MQTNINTLRQNNEDLEAEVKRLEEELVVMIKNDIEERAAEEIKHKEVMQFKKDLI